MQQSRQSTNSGQLAPICNNQQLVDHQQHPNFNQPYYTPQYESHHQNTAYNTCTSQLNSDNNNEYESHHPNTAYNTRTSQLNSDNNNEYESHHQNTAYNTCTSQLKSDNNADNQCDKYKVNQIPNTVVQQPCQSTSTIGSTCSLPRQSNTLTDSFDPFQHSKILKILKESAGSDNINWTCRKCFDTKNLIHIYVCQICKSPRFPTLLFDEEESCSAIDSSISIKPTETELNMNFLSLGDGYKPSRSEEGKNFWTCRECTLENPLTALLCKACEEAKSLTKSKRKLRKKEKKLMQKTGELKTESTPTSSSLSSSDELPWTCSVCTFENWRTTVICDMCCTISNCVYGKPPEEKQRLSDEEITNLKWNYIVTQCSLNKKLYVDDTFPMNLTSLYYYPERHKDDNIKWVRMRNARVDDIDQYLKWALFRDLLEPTDVYQGALGNCWFLGALNVLIERGHLIRLLFVTQQLCPQGAYQIRLCKDGVWTTVLIDDNIPCDEYRYLCYGQPVRKQLWVPLIEKATAKVFGCYEALQHGSVTEALNLLTGAACEALPLHPKDKEGVDLKFVWSTLLSAREKLFLMVASCNTSGLEVAEYEMMGLCLKHIYSILDVHETQGYRLLKLRDPYGTNAWRGNWSDNSHFWTPLLRSKLQPDGPQDGIFWIEFKDFVKYFYNIGICRVRCGWNETALTGTLPTFENQELTCISFIIFEPTELDFILYQENLRRIEKSQRDYMDLCLVLFKKLDSSGNNYKFLGYSNRLHQEFISFYKQLDPGEYVIVPISFNHWHSKKVHNLGYRLVIHSSKKIFAEDTVLSSLTLRDVIVSLVKKCGEIQAFQPGFQVYILKKEFRGSIMYAENHYDDGWVHLKCTNDKNCFNVVSSRGKTLKTIDSIPPLHGQIVAIYTQLKSSAQFSSVHQIDYRISNDAKLHDWVEDTHSLHLPKIDSKTNAFHCPFALEMH